MVCYGLVHLLVAFVAIRLILGSNSGSATGKGALAQLARDTAGRVTLGALAVGFAVLVVWQLAAAAIGYRDHDGLRRHLLRLGALGRAAVFGYLAGATSSLAIAGRSASSSPDSTTAKLMSLPAGPWLVALVGATIAGVGIGLAIFGWQKRFLEQLDERARRDGGRRIPVVVLGRFGYVAKGVAFVVVGVLLGWAAWTHDPQKSGGLDQALMRLLGGSLGKVAIVVIAVGVGCFGLFMLARARHLERDALTGE
nr:DUF1206 domain-containing protein [Nocardioides panaciterrulae]